MQCKFSHVKSDPSCIFPTIENGKNASRKKIYIDESFLFAADYLQQNEDEQITVTDLAKKMFEHCGDDETDGVQHAKNKLKEHFGDKIIISELNGKQNVVIFRKTVRSILQEFFEQSNRYQSTEEEKLSIIKTAAKILKTEILSSDVSMKALYPSLDEISAHEICAGVLTGSS
jgi:hypothetical protein